MNLILLERHEIGPEGHVTLIDGRATHLLEVLKVVADQEVRVGIVDGPTGSARR